MVRTAHERTIQRRQIPQPRRRQRSRCRPCSRNARADTYPSRPVHLLVGFPPGGTADIIARLTGAMLSERLGQTFVVENRGSAGQQVAAETVVKAAPDGYTLLLMANPNVINAMLNPNLSFNFTHDLAPVGGVDLNPLILEVNPSVPVQSVPELIAYAKAHPGKLNMASGGVGSTPHLAGELFKMMTGINMLHVPYRGDAPADHRSACGPGSGHVRPDHPVARPYPQRPVARARGDQRETPLALPDLPPVADFVPGYEAFAWQGVAAPKDTPPEIVAKLNTEINAALADPKIADASRRPRRRADADDARRFRQADRQRDREMGQGDQVRQYQGG